MLLSVIVPVYNVERYLENCIESILNQTYKNLEIILVNDGSTDNSGAICDKLASQYDNIKVIHKENGGQATARNEGIEIAQGEAITFMDSDDIYGEKETLEIAMSYLMEDTSLDIVQFPLQYTSEDGKRIAPFITTENKTYNRANEFLEEVSKWFLTNISNINTSVCNKVFRSHAIKSHRFIPIYCEDAEFLMHVATEGYKIRVQDKGSYVYIQRENSTMNSPRSLKKLRDTLILFNLIYSLLKKYSDNYEFYTHCLIVIDSTLQEIYKIFGRKAFLQTLHDVKNITPTKVVGDTKQRVKLRCISLLGLRNYSSIVCFINYSLLKR